MMLSELKPGQKGRILGVAESGKEVIRLLDMGFTPGTIVHVAACAPTGDPMLIEIRHAAVILRRKEAACLLVAGVNR